MILVGIAEAAKILDLHQVTCRKKAIRNEIPAYKVGNNWKFDPEELENFVKRGKNALEQEMSGHKEKLCQDKSYPLRKGETSGITRSPRPVVSGYGEVLKLTKKPKRQN